MSSHLVRSLVVSADEESDALSVQEHFERCFGDFGGNEHAEEKVLARPAA